MVGTGSVCKQVKKYPLPSGTTWRFLLPWLLSLIAEKGDCCLATEASVNDFPEPRHLGYCNLALSHHQTCTSPARCISPVVWAQEKGCGPENIKSLSAGFCKTRGAVHGAEALPSVWCHQTTSSSIVRLHSSLSPPMPWIEFISGV